MVEKGSLDEIKAKLVNIERKELREYIATARNQGHVDSLIEKELSKIGWPKDIIEDELSRKQEPAPNTKTSPQSFKEQSFKESSKAVIKLRNVSKEFGEHKILSNINLDIDRGEIFGIIGMSGSGKTTLLNSMIGFFQPDVGDIQYKNTYSDDFYPVNQDDAKLIFGFAPQDPSFYPLLTAGENLDLFASMYGMDKSDRDNRVKELLDLTELSDARDTLAENLSGGMQRRLGIACSIIHNPSILILDEPTSDLDPFLRKEMLGLIRKINRQGTTVIMASHFLGELETLCSRVGVLHKGVIIESGTPAQLKDRYSKNDEIHIELESGRYDSLSKSLRKEKLNISKVATEGNKMIVYTPEAEKVLHHMIHIIEKSKEKLIDIDVNRPTLNEVFESIVRK